MAFCYGISFPHAHAHRWILIPIIIITASHLGHVGAAYADVAVLSRLNAKVSQPSSKCCSPLIHVAVLQPDVLLIGSTTPKAKTGPVLYII